jgi:putative PEP-CTERM system TPR-repeat lipoprotein
MLPRFTTLSFLALLSFSATALQEEEQYYEDALVELGKDDIDSAYIYLKNALAENPSHLPSKLLMGEVLYARGAFNEALEELYEAEQLGADKNLTVVPVARSLLILKSYQSILNIDEQGLRPDIAYELLLIKASAQLYSDNPENGVTYLEKARKLKPSDVRTLQSFASHYLFTEKLDLALSYVSDAIAASGETAQNLHLKGQVAFAQERYTEAAEYFEEALSGSDDNPLIQRSLASTYLKLEQNDKALTIAQKIVDKTPGDPFAKLLLGQLRVKNNQTDIAKQIFNELIAALTLVPESVMQNNSELQFVNAFASYLNEDYEVAMKSLRSYILQNEDNLNAIALLADTHIKLGSPREAITVLDRKQSKVPNSIPLTVTLCNLYIEFNRSFKCDSLLTNAESIHGKLPSFDYVRINSFIERKRYKEALALFEEAFGNSDEEDLKLIGIEIKLALQMYDDAISDINAILTGESTYPLTLKLMKGTALLASGESQKALVLAEETVNQFPESSLATALYSEALLDNGNPQLAMEKSVPLYELEPSVKHALLVARAKSQLGNNEQAIEILTKAQESSDDNRISELLFAIYSSSGETVSALRTIDKLISQSRLDATYLLSKARLLTQEKRFSEATPVLDILFGLWRESTPDLLRLSQLQIAAQDYEGARQSLEEAKKLSADNLTVDAEIVRLKLIQGKTDGLDASLATLLSTAPKNANIQLLAGDYYSAIAANAKAFFHYEKAFGIAPNAPIFAAKMYSKANTNSALQKKFEALMLEFLSKTPNASFHKRLLADFYMQNSLYDKAKPHYLALSNTDDIPDKASILNNLALIELEQKPERALEHALEAYRLSPNSPYVLDTYGWVLAKTSRFDEALPKLREAYTLDATSPDIMYHLGYVLAKKGRLKEARVELTNALSSRKTFKERAEAETLLENL